MLGARAPWLVPCMLRARHYARHGAGVIAQAAPSGARGAYGGRPGGAGGGPRDRRRGGGGGGGPAQRRRMEERDYGDAEDEPMREFSYVVTCERRPRPPPTLRRRCPCVPPAHARAAAASTPIPPHLHRPPRAGAGRGGRAVRPEDRRSGRRVEAAGARHVLVRAPAPAACRRARPSLPSQPEGDQAAAARLEPSCTYHSLAFPPHESQDAHPCRHAP